MITTLTLNPALDKTLFIENFSIGQVNRVKGMQTDPGGKGINVSRVIQAMGGNTTALGFLGGKTGKGLLAKLNDINLNSDFIEVDGNTRTNIKIVDTINGACTDINEAGPYISPCKQAELREKISAHVQKSEMFVLSGSAQDSIPVTIYKDIIEALKRENKRVILDTSGGLLKEGIKAAPWLIKPNISELSEVFDVKLNGREDIIKACRELIDGGIKYVCVSMGADGLLMAAGQEVILAKPPEIKAKSTVGAGDCSVGSLAVSLLRNELPHTALKLACAVSAASVTLPGTQIPGNDLIKQIYDKVSVAMY